MIVVSFFSPLLSFFLAYVQMSHKYALIAHCIPCIVFIDMKYIRSRQEEEEAKPRVEPP